MDNVFALGTVLVTLIPLVVLVLVVVALILIGKNYRKRSKQLDDISRKLEQIQSAHQTRMTYKLWTKDL